MAPSPAERRVVTVAPPPADYQGEGHMGPPDSPARRLTALDVQRAKEGVTRPITRQDLIDNGIIQDQSKDPPSTS